MKARLKSSLILVTVFLLGGASGWGISRAQAERDFAARLTTPWPEYMRERRLAALDRRLELRDTQKTQIQQVMREDGPRFGKAMKQMTRECGSDFQVEKKRSDARIASVLDEKQRSEFERMLKEHPQW